jgi:peptidyl-prolyl cis-trans isomerase C
MKVTSFLVLAGALALVGCKPASNGGATSDANSAAPPVATVNGAPISRALYDFYVKGVAGKAATDLSTDQRNSLLDNLIRAELVASQAEKDGVAKDPDTANLLALTRLQVLSQAVSQHYLKDKKPTDEELRAEYESQIGTLPKTEYHAQHILVASEASANQLIDQLKKGADFGDLAKKNSTDSSKTSGGDLGWFTPDRMVRPFAEAVLTLKKGEYTLHPVQTQYGWHIIKLLDTRDATPPPFDAVKDRLVQLVQGKKFKAYEDGLVKAATVQKMLEAHLGAPAAPAAPATPAAPAKPAQ